MRRDTHLGKLSEQFFRHAVFPRGADHDLVHPGSLQLVDDLVRSAEDLQSSDFLPRIPRIIEKHEPYKGDIRGYVLSHAADRLLRGCAVRYDQHLSDILTAPKAHADELLPCDPGNEDHHCPEDRIVEHRKPRIRLAHLAEKEHTDKDKDHKRHVSDHGQKLLVPASLQYVFMCLKEKRPGKARESRDHCTAVV